MHAGGVADGPSHYYDTKDPFEELVSYVPDTRNWKGILISILVILGVGGVVACTVYAITPPKGPPRVQGHRIVFNQIYNGSFRPNPTNATWISGTELVFINSNGGLSVLDVEINQTRNLCDSTVFVSIFSYIK
ncbi:uncharacterized protein LOC111700951 [Eurytemora carolleeae]|uniref:uncharacterized protein LOC111700951 n=1 Tax=Eurytemora carolleeae TaxID=1294199 RepID=UPI000C77B9A7|nr:uncharacterized protein LOC111700951 [Eurytemora carolleeae]|eukprot:XP_023327803.1 uncharacterized protein LOC111700951 [Eurytemora affinis]